MKHIEIKTNSGTSQLFIKDQLLETIKVEGDFSDDEYKNSLRVYCTMLGTEGNSAFNVQLRAFGNLHPSYDRKSVAKPFQTISTMQVTIKQVEEVLAYMKREEGRYGHWETINGEQKWIRNPHIQNPHGNVKSPDVTVDQ